MCRRLKPRDRQTDGQIPRTSITIVCMSCSLKVNVATHNESKQVLQTAGMLRQTDRNTESRFTQVTYVLHLAIGKTKLADVVNTCNSMYNVHIILQLQEKHNWWQWRCYKWVSANRPQFGSSITKCLLTQCILIMIYVMNITQRMSIWNNSIK